MNIELTSWFLSIDLFSFTRGKALVPDCFRYWKEKCGNMGYTEERRYETLRDYYTTTGKEKCPLMTIKILYMVLIIIHFVELVIVWKYQRKRILTIHLDSGWRATTDRLWWLWDICMSLHGTSWWCDDICMLYICICNITIWKLILQWNSEEERCRLAVRILRAQENSVTRNSIDQV